MSDHQDTPPVYISPPSDRPPTGLSPLLVALISLPFALLVLLMVGAGVFIWIRGFRAHERLGTHLPIYSQKMRNGWTWYYLRPIGVSIANTVKPKPIDFSKDGLDRRGDITEYGGFRFAGRHLNTGVFGYWLRNDRTTTAMQADYLQAKRRKTLPLLKKTWQEPVVVAGLSGRMVVCEYVAKGYPCITKTAIVMVGKVAYYFEGTYFKMSEKWSEVAFSFELRTAHIDR